MPFLLLARVPKGSLERVYFGARDTKVKDDKRRTVPNILSYA